MFSFLEFGHRNGFPEECHRSSIRFVIDPTAAPNVRVKPFGDLKVGAELLTWKRRRSKSRHIEGGTGPIGVKATWRRSARAPITSGYFVEKLFSER